MAEDSLAILPRNMGQQAAGQKKKAAPRKFIPQQKGALITENPLEEDCPYTFSDSPAYLRQKKAKMLQPLASCCASSHKRFFRLKMRPKELSNWRARKKLVDSFGVWRSLRTNRGGTKHFKSWKSEPLCQAVFSSSPVHSCAGSSATTAQLCMMLKRHFCRDCTGNETFSFHCLTHQALKKYGSSTKAGPLAAALASFARLCLGSEVQDKGSCSKELRPLLDAWEQAEQLTLTRHALGQGLFKPRKEERLQEPGCPVDGMQAPFESLGCFSRSFIHLDPIKAEDGTYSAGGGVRLGYVLLKNQKDLNAPVVLHFHGTGETAADYLQPQLAEKYRDHYRGYGWSGGEPSLATFLKDAEPLAEKLPELFVQHGLSWPYPGGLILSGRSIGAQVAVHLAVLFPTLFRALVLDSAVATSATGDRLGEARLAALKQFHKELEHANLEVLQPLDAELWRLGTLDKIRAFNGQLLLLHGLEDDLVPYESSESLHAATSSRQKELVLVKDLHFCRVETSLFLKQRFSYKDASHNNIGHHQEYWHALRSFALKVQLDNTLPSVGPVLEHLCAVCAQKAVSKCGRCQKVWYCSRSHQAEHWKAHKGSCAGTAEPKVLKEADASLVTLVQLLSFLMTIQCRQVTTVYVMKSCWFQCSVILYTSSLFLASAEEKTCAGGSQEVCRCLLGCDVFGGTGTACRKTDNHLQLVDDAVRSAMQEDGSNCDGMKAVVHCANKLGCLDANVESRCLAVKHANHKCDVKCNHAWRKAAPSFVWLVAMLIVPLM
eukprot:symbB.v1.2.015326.t1/scaffold1138.1/size205980/25